MRLMGMAVAAGWTVVACGSRTGDYLGPGFEDGVGFGPGGVSGTGGVGGSLASSVGGGTQVSGTWVTHGFTAVTGSGVGATFGFSASASGQSSFVSGVGGSFGFSAVTGSLSAIGSTSATSTTGMGGASGSCCEVSSGPGCDDPDVTACVCNFDPFCCKYLWDGFCVQEVEQLGCGSCEAVGGAGGAMQSAVSIGGASSTTSTTGSTGSFMQSAVSGAGGASMTTSTTGEGGAGGVAECIAQSQTNCEACLCADCFQAYGDCVGDFGCPRIFECMATTGCTGLDCYAPDTCQMVIDRFGGLAGASVAYVTGLVACAADANCPCQ